MKSPAGLSGHAAGDAGPLRYIEIMEGFTDDHRCFVCGPENPAGLRLQFRHPGPGPAAEAEVVFPDHLQGWRNTVHGGLLATVLDETMIKAASAAGIKCVTAELTVKYLKPVACGVAYRVSGQVLDAHGRLVVTESALCDGSGAICARATGKMVKVP